MLCSDLFLEFASHDLLRHKSRKTESLLQTCRFPESIGDLVALAELNIKVAVFDPVLFVFLNKPRNHVKIVYWERTCSAFGASASKLSVQNLN